MLEAGEQCAIWPNDDAAVVAIDEDLLAFLDAVPDVRDPPDDRHAHRPGDDGHVGGERALLEHHGLQASPVIFEQFGRAEVAGDEDRIPRQSGLRRRPEAP